MFKIKYEIFEDDVEELRVMDMLTFDKEYNQIYGSFTVTFGGHDFIPYPPDHIPLSAKRLYSELILTYFELLNEAVTLLVHHHYIAIKYIENNSTWLELRVEKDCIKVSELECEIGPSWNSLICTEEKYFTDAKFGSFHDITILKEQFENEVKEKTQMFIEEIKCMNPMIVESKFFKRIFYYSAKML